MLESEEATVDDNTRCDGMSAIDGSNQVCRANFGYSAKHGDFSHEAPAGLPA